MSEQETHVGKLIQIENCKSDLDLELAAKRIIKDKYNLTILCNYCNTFTEMLVDDYSEDYLVIDLKIFEIIEDVRIDEGYVAKANRNSDRTINYIISFHNGGCGFGEAVEDAIDKMNKLK